MMIWFQSENYIDIRDLVALTLVKDRLVFFDNIKDCNKLFVVSPEKYTEITKAFVILYKKVPSYVVCSDYITHLTTEQRSKIEQEASVLLVKASALKLTVGD